MQLTQPDFDVLNEKRGADYRLTERIANAATYLLRKLAKDSGFAVFGLFYQEDMKNNAIFPDDGSEALQLVHETRGGGHWVALHRCQGQYMLYDSSYTNKLSRDLIFTIRRLAGKQQKDKLVLLIPKVSQQPDGTSCGLYAIANLTSVILKADPQVQRYNYAKLRAFSKN